MPTVFQPVRLRRSFRGGEVHDREGREGLSGVTGSAWRSGGTVKRAPEEFDDLCSLIENMHAKIEVLTHHCE